MDPGRVVHSTGLAKWLPVAVRLEDAFCSFASIGLTVSRDLLCFPGLLQVLSFITSDLWQFERLGGSVVLPCEGEPWQEADVTGGGIRVPLEAGTDA